MGKRNKFIFLDFSDRRPDHQKSSGDLLIKQKSKECICPHLEKFFSRYRLLQFSVPDFYSK